jgi:hypothetical protein
MSRIASRRLVYILSCAAAAIASALLHFWRIGSHPPGFYGDECSIAYNAYCIAETGADEYGVRWPVFFRSFDTYIDPINVYSVAGSIRLFGLHRRAARLPSGLYWFMACASFFILLRTWRLREWYALGGSFVLSLIPWIFPLSRNAAYGGLTAAYFGMITGFVCLDVALRRRSIGHAVGSGVACAFAVYASRNTVPVLILLTVGGGVVMGHALLRRRRVVVATFVSGLIVLLPFIFSALRLPRALTARFAQVGIMRKAHAPQELVLGIAGRYLDYFGPKFLFISGDGDLRHHTGWNGELSWYLAPLVLAGLYVTVRFWRSRPPYRIVLVGLLVSPIPAALTMDRMHGPRSAYATIFWVLLAVLGARWLWRRGGSWRKLLLVIVCAGGVEIVLYLHNYFGVYQTQCRPAFNAELGESLEYCFQHLQAGQVLYISPSTFSFNGAIVDSELKPWLYMYVLFYGKIDPHKYQQNGTPADQIQLYNGAPQRSGLLLRSNCFYWWERGADHQAYVAPDSMPLPVDARLVNSNTFAAPYSFLQYQVFEIPGATQRTPFGR